ncbi:MAG: polyprenyl synthetase family protein [Thaumarchaeota archaeon]|nr:polyprenyl synthetase family protein [Nitrososphaerota archaeon]
MATYERSDYSADEKDVERMLRPYREAVESGLKKLKEKDSKLDKLAFGFLEGGGKRIRPTITLLTCDAIKGSYAEAVPIAVAYELAHAASLTQDDIIDNSPTRHNRPTAHTAHGVTTAILLSDMMIFNIFEMLAEYEDADVSKSQLTTLIRYVAKSAKEAAEGEYLEMQLSKKAEPTIEEYVKLAGLKTGALFGAAAASGAVVGGGKPRVVKEMYEFGRNLGVAFQMVDDILDMTGTSKEMGKPMLKDLQNNAANVVIVHALRHADPTRRNQIRSMMVRSLYGFVEVDELLAILDDLGSVEYAAGLCGKHAALARGKLKSLPEGPARDILEKVTLWLEARRK